MKKLLILILAFCMVLPLAACDGKKPSGGGNNPANIKAWAFHSFDKTVVGATPGKNLNTDYTIYLAKGETEGCQVAIYSNEDLKNVTFAMNKDVSDATEAITTAMFSMDKTHTIKRKQYTDALIPYYGRRLQVKADVALPFMVEFTTTKDTPAGEYKYVYEVNDKDKKVIATFNITVHVWDIVLPEKKTFATAVGLETSYVSQSKGKYEEWYEACLQHNMSPYKIPVDILSDEANAYLDDPRMTSFQVFIPKNEDGTINEAKLLEYYKKLKTNKVWLDKAFFYPVDEPRTEGHLVELREYERILTQLCPEIEICAPFYTNIQLSANKDQTDDMTDYTRLWCPKLCLWDDSQSYKSLNYRPDKTFEERMNEQIAKGDRMWTYVCNSPDDPYAQMFIDTVGANQRLMFWQMWQRDIDGFLYWSVNSYGVKNNILQNPWETVKNGLTSDKGTIYGCGFLFYPGYYVGYGGACPSIRAKIVRDGCDDIELLNLAEQYLGKDWVKEKTKEGTPTLTEFASGDKYAALRIEIGNALEAAMKNQ